MNHHHLRGSGIKRPLAILAAFFFALLAVAGCKSGGSHPNPTESQDFTAAMKTVKACEPGMTIFGMIDAVGSKTSRHQLFTCLESTIPAGNRPAFEQAFLTSITTGHLVSGGRRARDTWAETTVPALITEYEKPLPSSSPKASS